MARNNGTTGYGDKSIAFFDQLMRIKCIEKIVCQYYEGSNKTMLDFGCGTGDFLHYFSPRCRLLVGYDPSNEILEIAQIKCKNLSNVLLVNSLDNILDKFDIILSITVLQHILSDSELLKTLTFMSNISNNNGILIALESTKCDSFNLAQPSHVNARSMADWLSFFDKCGWELLSIKSFYNPFYLKTKSYIKYRKTTYFQRACYKIINHFDIDTNLFNGIFKQQAERILSDDRNIDGILNGESFSKIFILRRK